MASVGRGMILQNMKNNALEKDKQSKQLNSKKSALVATFGRGTSSSGLMTPSQFIKKSSSGSSISSSSTSVKSLSMPDNEDTFKKSPSTSPATSPKINQRLKEMLLNDEKTDSENVELAEQESNKQSENKKMEINSPPLEEEKSEEMLKTEDATKTITTNPFLPANNYFENPDPQQAKEVESSCSIDSEKQTTEAVTESNSIDIKPSFDEASDTSNEIFISENNDTKHGGEEKPKDLKRDIFCKEKAPERSEDEKWKLYQVERKITKIIKSITLQNLGDAFDELECLVEERPLSSRFMNCSEVELLLEALMKSAIQNADFLPLAPCLIKMVSEHQPLEFKQYFPDIVERKYKENVTLSASEEILNKNGQHFCKLVGNLFAMPRQTGNTLFDLVSPIIEEYVERWTIPDGTEVGCDGLQETKLLMEATAVKYLLLEITNKMLPCDREVEKEMEKFVWFVRESVLNAAIPKKIREIYLDGLIEVQTTNGEDGMSVSASAFEMLTATSNSQTESDADVYFESDSCYEDALPTVTDGLSSSNVELPNDTLKEEPEKDQIDLNNIELPKFDTIAMAPTIGNAFDTSRTIPKATASGSGKMAMNFTGRNEVLDDSDADIIIEDDDDDEDVTSSSIKPPPSIFLASSSSIHKDSLVHNQSNHSSPITSTVFPKKKLPLGRGRGLARLPDFGSKDYADKPIANVNPINYSSSESSLSSENKYAACNDDLSDLKNKRPQSSSNNTISNNDHMRPAGNRNQNQNRNFNSDNNSRTNSMQQRGRFNNGSNEYTGGYGNNNNNNNGNSNNSGVAGGCGFFNDRRTANFQKNNNNRNGNNQQRGNFNRNNNSSQNNNWRDRNHNNNNNNNKREERKARKMNFQPTYNNNNSNNNKNMNRDGQTQNVAVGAAASPKMSRSEKSERDGMEKVYHPNGRLEYKPKPSTKVEFGDVVPTHCLRCNSDEHFSEQCTVKNFFF